MCVCMNPIINICFIDTFFFTYGIFNLHEHYISTTKNIPQKNVSRNLFSFFFPEEKENVFLLGAVTTASFHTREILCKNLVF